MAKMSLILKRAEQKLALFGMIETLFLYLNIFFYQIYKGNIKHG